MTTAHAIHVEPVYERETHKTFDESRGDTKVPAGLDIYDEEVAVGYNPKTDRDEIVVIVPEMHLAYWEFTTQRQVNVPADCPDCTRGLWVKDDLKGFGPFYVCFNVTEEDHVDPCHTGCIVACGHERGWRPPEPETEPVDIIGQLATAVAARLAADGT